MTIRILRGDCRDVLPTLPDESVHACVTSPPYFGLRSYLPDGHPDKAREIGAEPTLAAYIETLTAVFREIRRVLRSDGTCWLNCGDSYANSGGQGQPHRDSSGGIGRKGTRGTQPYHAAGGGFLRPSSIGNGLKPKDLMLVPARLALALQADGWWLRSDVIWSKPNPMPESVIDRPTSAHEHIFLLTKSAKYFYDADAVRTNLRRSSLDRLAQDVDAQAGSARANGGAKTNGAMKAVARLDKQRGHSRRHAGFNDRWDAMSKDEQMAGGANLRNVWTISTGVGFRDAHFAVFPAELAERCIKAGCPEGGTVLDPFGGSGTVGLVADRLNREAILIELNPEYARMAERRIRDDAPMFADVEAIA